MHRRLSAAMPHQYLGRASPPSSPAHVAPPRPFVPFPQLLDNLSNAGSALGVEKLLAHFGAALMVALLRPQARELVAGAFEGGWDPQQLLSYLRAAL